MRILNLNSRDVGLLRFLCALLPIISPSCVCVHRGRVIMQEGDIRIVPALSYPKYYHSDSVQMWPSTQLNHRTIQENPFSLHSRASL